MRWEKKVRFIAVLCMVLVVFVGCSKEIGPEGSKTPKPGPDGSETVTTSIPEPTKSETISPEPTSVSTSPDPTLSETEGEKKGNLTIRLNAKEVYFNETKVEYSFATLKKTIESSLSDNGDIYLDDWYGDYHLSEEIREDISSLGYSPILVND